MLKLPPTVQVRILENQYGFEMKASCFKYIVEEEVITGLHYPVFLDTSSVFLRKNEIFRHQEIDYAVIADTNNLVLFSGAPLEKRSILKAMEQPSYTYR